MPAKTPTNKLLQYFILEGWIQRINQAHGPGEFMEITRLFFDESKPYPCKLLEASSKSHEETSELTEARLTQAIVTIRKTNALQAT